MWVHGMVRIDEYTWIAPLSHYLTSPVIQTLESHKCKVFNKNTTISAIQTGTQLRRCLRHHRLVFSTSLETAADLKMESVPARNQ